MENNKDLPGQVFSPGEVDLMFWQYCVGIVHAVSHWPEDKTIELTLLNALADTRHHHLEKVFRKAPSFSIVFELQAGKRIVSMKKITK